MQKPEFLSLFISLRDNNEKKRSWREVILLQLPTILLVIFGLFPSLVKAKELCWVYGENHQYLRCHFGLELWEEGKKSDRIFQQWDLECILASDKPVSCTLKRTYVIIPGEGHGGFISIHNHSTENGTLKFQVFDWKNGLLDFFVIYPKGDRMPVLIRLKPSSELPNYFEVETFQAKDVAKTFFSQELVAQEWRIPEYTYTLNVPIRLEGKKSEFQKVKDELMSSLSPKDKQVFDSLKTADRGCLDFNIWLNGMPEFRYLEERLKEIERKMTEAKGKQGTFKELQDQRKAVESELMALWGSEEFKKFVRVRMETCLGEAGMSQGGRKAVVNFFLSDLFRSSVP